eukprot:746348-Hanusia_phi.AAC.1
MIDHIMPMCMYPLLLPSHSSILPLACSTTKSQPIDPFPSNDQDSCTYTPSYHSLHVDSYKRHSFFPSACSLCSLPLPATALLVAYTPWPRVPQQENGRPTVPVNYPYPTPLTVDVNHPTPPRSLSVNRTSPLQKFTLPPFEQGPSTDQVPLRCQSKSGVQTKCKGGVFYRHRSKAKCRGGPRPCCPSPAAGPGARQLGAQKFNFWQCVHFGGPGGAGLVAGTRPGDPHHRTRPTAVLQDPVFTHIEVRNSVTGPRPGAGGRRGLAGPAPGGSATHSESEAVRSQCTVATVPRCGPGAARREPLLNPGTRKQALRAAAPVRRSDRTVTATVAGTHSATESDRSAASD